MTEQHEVDREDRDIPANADQDMSEQERAAAAVEDHAASLRRRGAVARPREENPAEVAPKEAPTQ